MEVLDNDHIDEQSGEGLVIQYFEKMTFWQRLVGLALIFCSVFFWWVLLRDPYIKNEQYNIFFSVGTTLTLSGIAILFFSVKQTKTTKEIRSNTVSQIFKQQSYLFTILVVAALFFVSLTSYYLSKMVIREMEYSTSTIDEERPMSPPPPAPEEIEVVEELEELMDRELPEAQSQNDE